MSPCRPTCVAFVGGAERDRAVLDDEAVVAAGDREHALHVDRQPEVVDDRDRARPRGDQALQLIEVDVAGARLGVDEDGLGAARLDRVRHRHVRLRGHQHLVARAELEEEVGEVERRHAGRGRDRVRCAGEVGERGLELLHARAVRERGAAEHVGDRRPLLLAEHRLSKGDHQRVEVSRRPPRLRRVSGSAARSIAKQMAITWNTSSAVTSGGGPPAAASTNERDQVRPSGRPGRASRAARRGVRRRPDVHSVACSSPLTNVASRAEHLHVVVVGVHAAEVGRHLHRGAALELEQRDHQVVEAELRALGDQPVARSPARAPAGRRSATAAGRPGGSCRRG